jgi:1,2-beta-oligoglucan phosphorylase
MPNPPTQRLTTPRAEDLGLKRIGNSSGLVISLLPNGAIFAIEHVEEGRRIMINQSLGSPVAGAMGRLCLRIGGSEPMLVSVAGAEAHGRVGVSGDRFLWQGETRGVRHEVSLSLHAGKALWLWHVVVGNGGDEPLPCDSVLIQDLGLGEPRFLMSNEAYASQYLDHHIARHPRIGYILMGRQNLEQNGRHPWVAHGCLEGAAAFATDFRQLMGPAHRDADHFAIPFGTNLPSMRLQHESACAALQCAGITLTPGATAAWTFFGLYSADHPAASADTDLALIDDAVAATAVTRPAAVELFMPARSLLQDAPAAVADPLDEAAIRQRYPRQLHVERVGGRLLSCFTPADTHDRHVVLRDKERTVLRRHGAVLRGGAALLPDEATLSVTCWMHGVFGAQLTIGNSSFHRLFSVSRDPYNITRGSGVRMLVDTGAGWRLLTVPSAFEIGLDDCRWLYRLGSRTITVSAVVCGDEPAVQWSVAVAGAPCRFLVFCHLALGERELEHAAQLEIDASQKRFSFRPDPQDGWSRCYPQAVYHLVTSTPGSIEAIGGDELLHSDGRRRSGAYAAMRTSPTSEFVFTVVGSMTDPQRAAWLATRYSGRVDQATIQAQSARYWRKLTRGIHIASPDGDPGAGAIDTIFPWLVHDAIVHLSVAHGLEQYTGGAWGTRDVCQGPMELLLALEHDEPARAILRIVFAQQYAQRGDWPQWFMLEPYSAIQDRQAHGDVIVWPLKALCDYVEATGDFAILGESIPWRREDNLQHSAEADPIATHVDRLIATLRQRFVPGTHLLRYGNGDWNDSLQPVDASKRDWMVSSWTVALLYEQLCRYAEIVRRAGRADGGELRLAAAMREDFNRCLIRAGTVAGYGVFSPQGALPELLFHPQDQRTGVAYSLLPMTQAIAGGLFTPEQAQHHLGLIREHLRFADGVRLMDRPIAYHGGPQTIFQRAESAAFFGREIGLMYTHAHLRYAQALALLGEAQELWDALLAVNPISVTDRLAHASLRQRNTYFSSSDAAFADRYQAGSEWARVRAATIAVDGGWRIYSSGPGLYTNVLMRHALGARRYFGARLLEPCLPPALQNLTLDWPGRPAPGSPPR